MTNSNLRLDLKSRPCPLAVLRGQQGRGPNARRARGAACGIPTRTARRPRRLEMFRFWTFIGESGSGTLSVSFGQPPLRFWRLFMYMESLSCEAWCGDRPVEINGEARLPSGSGSRWPLDSLEGSSLRRYDRASRPHSADVGWLRSHGSLRSQSFLLKVSGRW